jgi:hypothetical protein
MLRRISPEVVEAAEPVILRPSFGRRISRDISILNAVSGSSGEILVENRATAFRSEIFREILRPKDGLRMTKLGV